MPGDDLVDDFVPDELVALSAEEDEVDDGNIPIFSDAEDQTALGSTLTQSSEAKKRKRREKEKQRKKVKLAQSAQQAPANIAEDKPQAQADYLASMQVKSFSKLSELELEDMRIPVASLADTQSWLEPRSLETLPQFISQVIPTLHTRLLQRSKTTAAPTMLFITSAALRATDVTRILKSFIHPQKPKKKSEGKGDSGSKAGEVAKLFGKHFKIAEHKAYLEKTKIGSGVGTPGRVAKLLEEGALNVAQLTHLVLDITFRDVKQRSLFEIPECRDDLFKMFASDELGKRIKEGKTIIVFY